MTSEPRARMVECIETCYSYPCPDEATHSVYDAHGWLQGRFCKSHAEQEVAELNGEENPND